MDDGYRLIAGDIADLHFSKLDCIFCNDSSRPLQMLSQPWHCETTEERLCEKMRSSLCSRIFNS